MHTYTFRVYRTPWGWSYTVYRDGEIASQPSTPYRSERMATSTAKRAIKRYQQLDAGEL